eukprot:15264160-Ditylum_brightwellii.AAC.1
MKDHIFCPGLLQEPKKQHLQSHGHTNIARLTPAGQFGEVFSENPSQQYPLTLVLINTGDSPHLLETG